MTPKQATIGEAYNELTTIKQYLENMDADNYDQTLLNSIAKGLHDIHIILYKNRKDVKFEGWR